MFRWVNISHLNIKNENVPIKKLDKILKIISKNRDIAKLKEQNRLTRVGSSKSGYWEVIELKL